MSQRVNTAAIARMPLTITPVFVHQSGEVSSMLTLYVLSAGRIPALSFAGSVLFSGPPAVTGASNLLRCFLCVSFSPLAAFLLDPDWWPSVFGEGLCPNTARLNKRMDG